uniref:Uncharacterized protein n=1 Tax=Romanomermis culicivorax TaxID=13658 RepID=A0A915HRX0_ROMCU
MYYQITILSWHVDRVQTNGTHDLRILLPTKSMGVPMTTISLAIGLENLGVGDRLMASHMPDDFWGKVPKEPLSPQLHHQIDWRFRCYCKRSSPHRKIKVNALRQFPISSFDVDSGNWRMMRDLKFEYVTVIPFFLNPCYTLSDSVGRQSDRTFCYTTPASISRHRIAISIESARRHVCDQK